MQRVISVSINSQSQGTLLCRKSVSMSTHGTWQRNTPGTIWQKMLHRQDTHSCAWMPLGRGATCSTLADLHDCGVGDLFSLPPGPFCI